MKKFYRIANSKEGYSDGWRASLELSASQQTMRLIFVQASGTQNSGRKIIKEFVAECDKLLKKYGMEEQ